MLYGEHLLKKMGNSHASEMVFSSTAASPLFTIQLLKEPDNNYSEIIQLGNIFTM